ncbi:MAG: hypothetical protein HYX75_24680 [Acidobacteria bacterium]|nr:hypothetical protein [Acidobacteriota bacterium]
MSKDKIYRPSAVLGAVLLIGVGAFFLYGNFHPAWDPWPLVARYWPVLLILLGLAKLWDYLWLRTHPDSTPSRGLSAGIIVLILAVVFIGIGLTRGRVSRRVNHESQSVERRGMEAVRARIEMNAGELRLSGGATKLLEADFDYAEAEGKPRVKYEASGGQGDLTIIQQENHFSGFNVGPTRNDWDLRLNNDVPLDLKLRMGAGRTDLRLKGLSLTRLDIKMGAGELEADLTGDWKHDLDATIQGGVGSATIRLPRDVGVRVNAVGGLGAINPGDLMKSGGAYVNEAYGKSATTLRLSVAGGIGEINLRQEK